MASQNLDKNDIWVGTPDQRTTGPILSAKLGTTAPTEVGDALSKFTASGWVDEDGLSLSTSRGYEQIKDWSGQVVREMISEFTNELSWKHIGMDAESWRNYVGDENVSEVAADGTHGKRLKITFNNVQPPRKAWAFRIKDGKRRMLIFVPEGQVAGEGELTFKATEAITLPIKMKCFPDSDGNHIYIFTDDGATAAG